MTTSFSKPLKPETGDQEHVFERGAAEVGDVVFGEAAEGHPFEVRVFFGVRDFHQEDLDAARGDGRFVCSNELVCFDAFALAHANHR